MAGVPKFCFTACITFETMFLNTEAQYHHAHSLGRRMLAKDGMKVIGSSDVLVCMHVL